MYSALIKMCVAGPPKVVNKTDSGDNGDTLHVFRMKGIHILLVTDVQTLVTKSKANTFLVIYFANVKKRKSFSLLK